MDKTAGEMLSNSANDLLVNYFDYDMEKTGDVLSVALTPEVLKEVRSRPELISQA